jgi:dTDP-4-amino-4,6-dideoxygalactose transaminase
MIEPDWSRGVYHLFVIRVQNREEVMKRLAEENIGTGIHYPVPLHLQNAYVSLGYRRGDFPVSEAVAPEIVSLPMFPQLRKEQQERVVESLARVVFGARVGPGLNAVSIAAGD